MQPQYQELPIVAFCKAGSHDERFAVEAVTPTVFQVNRLLITPGAVAAFNQRRPVEGAQARDHYAARHGRFCNPVRPNVLHLFKSGRRSLNRPKANAFNEELIDAAKQAFKQAKKDIAVRCVLLNANGKIFSAGQDVGDFKAGERVSFRQHLLRTYNPLIIQMRRLEKPIIAAINGAVAGAALGIVLACDLRIASEKARFIVGFGGIGLAPDSAVSLMLPTIIGLGRAAEAIYFNQPISAEQALDWGLVNRIIKTHKETGFLQ